MTTILQPLLAILNLNTRLFANCLDGVDDASGVKRLDSSTNSMTFIAAHLVDARHFLATSLGAMLVDNPTESLRDVQSVEEAVDLPSLDQLRSGWQNVTGSLLDRLGTVSEEELRAEFSRRFPIEDSTVLGAISFLLQHESYHLGQLGFIRKQLGFDPMTYGEPDA